MHVMKTALAATAVIALTAAAAQAKIQCNGAFQIMKRGGEISTPYCADGQVAAVARQYGMKVSADAVRNNPSEKQRACRLAGDDIRIKDACAGYRNDRPGKF